MIGSMTGAPRHYYPVVAFDLDGTLLRHTSVLQLLAQHVGQAEAVAGLARGIAAGEISSRAVADRSAAWFTGHATSEFRRPLMAGSWIDGIDETLKRLSRVGTHVLLATITWRFAAELVAERYGFAAVSGTELQTDDGIIGGNVTRYFDGHDKLRFVEDWCANNGFAMSQVAAVGDSRGDVPLFLGADRSVALNATADAQHAASRVIDTADLRDVLPLLTR